MRSTRGGGAEGGPAAEREPTSRPGRIFSLLGAHKFRGGGELFGSDGRHLPGRRRAFSTFSADPGPTSREPLPEGGGEGLLPDPAQPPPGVRQGGARGRREPIDDPRCGKRETARARRVDVHVLAANTSARPPSVDGAMVFTTGEMMTHPVKITWRPASRPNADSGRPVSESRRWVVRARFYEGAVWYCRSRVRNVSSGRRDPAAVPAVRDDACER